MKQENEIKLPTCEECRWWNFRERTPENHRGVGECRMQPPVFDNTAGKYRVPLTRFDFWCAQGCQKNYRHNFGKDGWFTPAEKPFPEHQEVLIQIFLANGVQTVRSAWNFKNEWFASNNNALVELEKGGHKVVCWQPLPEPRKLEDILEGDKP